MDYEDEQPAEEVAGAGKKQDVKGNYVSVHSSTFKDFLLKDELLRAIADCGFEHPSEGLVSFQACSLMAGSPARVHPASYSWWRHCLSSQEWHGKDSSLCALNSSPSW